MIYFIYSDQKRGQASRRGAGLNNRSGLIGRTLWNSNLWKHVIIPQRKRRQAMFGGELLSQSRSWYLSRRGFPGRRFRSWTASGPGGLWGAHLGPAALCLPAYDGEPDTFLLRRVEARTRAVRQA